MIKKFIFLFVSALAFFSCDNESELLDSKPHSVARMAARSVTHQPLVVGYFPSWSETYPSGGSTKLRNTPEEVTHIFLSFVKPNMRYVKGSFDIKQVGIEVPYDGVMLKETVDILKAKGIKVILSIGGETYWGTDEAYDINHQQIADFVRDFGFDGIDWDYEPNGGFATIGEPQNVDRFIDMIKYSRVLLPREEGYLIACAPAGCGALGRSIPYPANDDPESPYAYAKRAEATGDDLANEYNATSAEGYTISLYGFASTGHMIPVFNAVGDMLDFVAFQGYNIGSASKREIMYDSYAYYANKHGFRVAFGMHVPQEPWGPFYTYDESRLREFTEYVAQGGKHNRSGKGDGVMFWQLLQKSAINPALDGNAYAQISYSILENFSPVTSPSAKIASPVNNALIREGEIIKFAGNVKRATSVSFFVDDILIESLHAEPYSVTLDNLSIGIHKLKIVATNDNGEMATDEISIKIIDANSVENVPAWKSDMTYATSGTEVYHNGCVWSNKWWTQGDEPGKSDVWQYVRGGGNEGGGNEGGGNEGGGNEGGGNEGGGNEGGVVAEYNPSQSYPQSGTIVIYQGKKYKNKWWANAGETPGTPNGPWELILENGEGTTPDMALPYDLNMAYPTPNTHVLYNGQIYKNKWYVSIGDYPGKDPWGPWVLLK